MVKPALVVAVLFRTLDTMRMFDLPWGMIGPGKYSVETMSMFAYVENNALRYGAAAAYSLLLFAYIVIVAFLFVRLLGADVIGDEESRALTAQRKKQKELNKARRRGTPLAKSPSPVGRASNEHRNSHTVSGVPCDGGGARSPQQAPRGGKYWASQIAIIAGMAFIVLYCIAPFYWMIVSSLRLPTEGRETSFWPDPVSFENYPAVFRPENGFGQALLNSVIVSLTTTLLTLLLGILGAYALARLRFWREGPRAVDHHRLLDVPRHHPADPVVQDVHRRLPAGCRSTG